MTLVPSSPAVIAHRGNSWIAPQNTLAAFEAAWRADADMVELDIQLSADGEIVVIHDDTVDATTDGAGEVGAMTLTQLRALDAGSWFAPAFAGQRIPTLGEVLGFLADRPGTDLLLELKDVWAPGDAARVTSAVEAAGLRDRVVVQSFYPQTVAALRDAAPALRRGLLVERHHDGLLEGCAELGVMTCNPSVELVLGDAGLVPALHAAGLQVMVWTADDVAQWQALTAAGVDAIITDRPDRLAGWLGGRGAR
ncbi:glycerophosphodiester phosphodiesterase [Xylanimonas protaetiae]|uniref:Glycerophosphodiester phosphodiesterase n=1 Tax=Xylanimonas protaetiae TaxID=2509457 RepID=A0A4P6F246_9MICO|nr:glycerophosphodiester phosphodiesterase family protein [Xylanimonas protaetiae]QAY69256.1 glycerophosphodiester phosphodiesterase [Xylanimonas protaetiae]